MKTVPPILEKIKADTDRHATRCSRFSWRARRPTLRIALTPCSMSKQLRLRQRARPRPLRATKRQDILTTARATQQRLHLPSGSRELGSRRTATTSTAIGSSAFPATSRRPCQHALALANVENIPGACFMFYVCVRFPLLFCFNSMCLSCVF